MGAGGFTDSVVGVALRTNQAMTNVTNITGMITLHSPIFLACSSYESRANVSKVRMML